LTLRYLAGREALFAARMERRFVVDGHADLLADDIFCLADGPRILDCLEFDDRLRYLDGLDDAAFLGMDLGRLGAPDLAAKFLAWYVEFAGDPAPPSLLHHYLAYREVVMQRLEGRVALVTGAASGIGHAIAVRFADEGAAVAVTDIQDEPGEVVAKGIRETGGLAVFAHHDVASQAEWERAVGAAAKEFGGLDILVNNAGMGDLAVIEETSLEDYQRTIAIDQTGVFLGMKVAAELLSASPHGSVINISSIFGTSGGFGTSPAYHAAKGAVRTLTKNNRAALGGQGHPGQLRAPGFHRHRDP
jgi:NAD(P)-dependent dehydrogenase (short-subunit alcohol dehydrogenase family)